jgi:hypothetical protein
MPTSEPRDLSPGALAMMVLRLLQRDYQRARAGTKHLATAVSRFEQMLSGVSFVLARGGGDA